jgi:hypothetical protein
MEWTHTVAHIGITIIDSSSNVRRLRIVDSKPWFAESIKTLTRPPADDHPRGQGGESRALQSSYTCLAVVCS